MHSHLNPLTTAAAVADVVRRAKAHVPKWYFLVRNALAVFLEWDVVVAHFASADAKRPTCSQHRGTIDPKVCSTMAGPTVDYTAV